MQQTVYPTPGFGGWILPALSVGCRGMVRSEALGANWGMTREPRMGLGWERRATDIRS